MTSGVWRFPGSDDGSGMLLAMLLASAMLALGLGLVAVASTERAMAANARMGAEALYAAEALGEVVIGELLSDASWTPALAGARHSAFFEAGVPMAPWHAPVDLAAMTSRQQAQSDAAWPAGPDRPAWLVFAAGSFASLVSGGPAAPLFVTAWIADDPADADGDPNVDANGIVMVRALAIGVGGLQRGLQIALRRDVVESGGEAGMPAVRVESWRELR